MSDDGFDAYDLSEFTEQDFAAIDAALARAHGGPAVQIAVEDSPFRRFLSWKKHLAVTDLVSPLWCEVQYEYGLYGKRNKPLHLRPSAFKSKNGKQIRVHRPVAHANDQRLKRGKSVHKALEDELHPEKLVVRVVSEEERFGLRLLQLIDGFNQLVIDGITRELPVFAITHGQVVMGVIDEVLRSPLTPPASLSSATQQVASSVKSPTAELYELCIVDYKTRRSQNVPLDEDSLSPRLQLMMYHRMLSSVLAPEAFDFGLLWSRLKLDPMRPFSPQFSNDILWKQRQTGPTDCSVHLNRLVSEWTFTVQRKRAGLMGVSQHLRLVYRRSVYAGKREKGKHKAAETVDADDPLQALVLQEELDFARAIEASLSEMGHRHADQVAHHVAQHIKQVGPSSVCQPSAIWKNLVFPLDSQTDATIAWTTQESLLNCAHKVLVEASPRNLQQTNPTRDPPADETRSLARSEGSTGDISPIIGKKEFRMNDEELDTHVADVLRWWFGARPPRGVDIGQTHRCFTCEYRESCEWREEKAREAGAGKSVGGVAV